MDRPKVALVHDYLTQRGGAERVVLAMTRAWPHAPLHTSLYEASSTYPEFGQVDVRTLPLDRLGALRRNHRLALPLLAPAFTRCRVAADVAVCSSSGWAHGAKVDGRKVVYCHTPARWLYQPDQYLRDSGTVTRSSLAALRPYLERWDRRAAASATRYLANSTIVRQRVRDLYGIEADLLPPPFAVSPAGPQQPVEGTEPGFYLCISRLLPYKNVDAVVAAFAELGERLVVVGAGPSEERLRAVATGNVRLVGTVGDAELRWLYANSAGMVAASYEDYGLTPLEAAAFGKPTAVLRWGGFLDTVVEDETGVFFDLPEPGAVREAVKRLTARSWPHHALQAHAARFSEDRFLTRLRQIVEEELTAA